MSYETDKNLIILHNICQPELKPEINTQQTKKTPVIPESLIPKTAHRELKAEDPGKEKQVSQDFDTEELTQLHTKTKANCTQKNERR